MFIDKAKEKVFYVLQLNAQMTFIDAVLIKMSFRQKIVSTSMKREHQFGSNLMRF